MNHEELTQASASVVNDKPVTAVEAATVRFCGDSGDGMQLAGTQFGNTTALAGTDLATFPDYPAEIRAPRGTLAGVSGFQIHFASRKVFTPGDRVDVLVVMNAAALATNLKDLVRGGILIVNADGFGRRELQMAGYRSNPLEDGSLEQYQVYPVEMTKLTREAVKDTGLGTKEADRCRNFFALGLVYWLYDRPLEPTLRFIAAKFGKRPEVAEANRRALLAGYNYGITTEAIQTRYSVDRADLPPGVYRSITGNQALAWGLMAAAKLSGCTLFYSGYPITPASDILHELARRKNFGVRTFQAEDEIAAASAAIGAAFGGAMAVTGTSGPGLSLKGEALGLAVMVELPMLVIDVQRAGPSTGMPTKTEQADLNIALFGRHGECPMPVLAPLSPGDCFQMAIEAWRIATAYMTPVMILSDAYLANGSEPWRLPDLQSFEPIAVEHPQSPGNGAVFHPYQRNDRLARPWALPGTPGLEHRVGGLEKADVTGNVSYDPENHQRMVCLRAEKVARIARYVPELTVEGPADARLLVLGWGSSYGAIASAVRGLWASGAPVAHAHLRYLNPFPPNLEQIVSRYQAVLIPELNCGQLRAVIRSRFLVDAHGLNKTTGKPFTVAEVADAITQLLE